MDIGSILVILAIAIIIVGYITRPLIEYRGFAVTDSDRRFSILQAQRDQILTVLQELDMDHAMGKVPRDDYEAQRSVLVTRGAAVLKELDLLAGVNILPEGQEDILDNTSKELETQIEEAVSQLRGESGDSEINFCSNCGNALESGDRFCTQCGISIRVGEA